MATMISTAFPKEAFRRPERVCPSFNDSWSVASPNSCKSRENRSITENDGEKTQIAGLGVGLRYLRERHNCDEAEQEPQASIPVKVVRNKAQRHKHEQDVHPGPKEEISA